MTPDLSGPDRNEAISDLAVFHSRRLKLGLDRTTAKPIALALSTGPGMKVAHNLTQRVWRSSQGAFIVLQHKTGRIEEIKPGHPRGYALPAVYAHGLRMGLGLDREDYGRLYDLAEKTLTGVTEDRRLAADVPYNGSLWSVSIDLKDRLVLNLHNRVYDYATDHAIKRAKERYSLVLTYEAARFMHEAMESGNYVRQESGHEAARLAPHTIRATVHYDMEDFTIVYDPDTKMIVTVTPPGDFDYARKLAGA